MAPKFHLYLLQGSFYSGALASICTLTHDPWPFENNLAILGFWLGFSVPFGLVWGRLNSMIKTVAKLNLGAPSFVSLKGIGLDLSLNQIGYHMIFTPVLFTFMDHFSKFPPKVPAVNNITTQEDTATEEKEKEEKLIGLYKDAINFRTKLICGSLFTDLLLMNQFNNGNNNHKKLLGIFNTKNFALMLSWHTFLLFGYFKDLRKQMEAHKK